MAGAGWIRVPVGDDSARWATRGRGHRVLLVVHNVTAATRLLDVLPLFHDDFRVQLLATCPGSSAFEAGVRDVLAQTGVPVLPWEQAVRTPVALAISASFGGQLRSLSGQLAVLSHGAGYTKRLATPDTRHPTPGAGRAVSEPVFGLSPEWLLDEFGKPIADALVLSHPEQYERLRAACPEAEPTAVLAGDPCWDRMLAARPYRDRFRRALGVGRGQRLVVLNSTWNPDSLFGDGGDDVLPSLLPRLTSEFPADEYRLAAVLHPNIWHGHGPGQIRAWLDRARRAGLALVDPLHGWRQALIAADAVIGDHGSVTYYAAALGTPVLLGAAPLSGLAPDAPVHAFVRTAPRLDPALPLRGQVERLISRHQPPPEPSEFVSSSPGESAARLRRLFYDVMGIPEPDHPARLEPLPLPPYEPAVHTVPLTVLTQLQGACEIAVTRYAGPHRASYGTGEAHTAVSEDTRETDQLALADVVFRHGEPDDPRFGSPAQWTAEVLRGHPHCSLAAYVTSAGSCVVRTRAGVLVRLHSASDADPAAYASALHAWVSCGRSPEELYGRGLTVRTGDAAHAVTVTPL
ncbi:hypothetical protein OHT76_35635 [Streptomyces sp. NBC_00287]|uniref:hypothetical protein n=1 Tax=Streptomyces sp. NBC_00287 TaxID=2975702 RepID=UPI002E2CE84A|nr:hypothetical protein [Streptomyces sp. NBC_00287]